MRDALQLDAAMRTHMHREQNLYNNNSHNKHAYAGQLNSWTHLRGLLVLHDRGILAHTQLASLGIIPPTEVTQILVLWLGYYDFGTIHTARPASN
jgi:hypothetical protein